MKVTGNNYEISKYLSETASKEASKTTDTAIKGVEAGSRSNQSGARQDVIVELSQTSQEVQMAREVVEAQPDMREEKVAALRMQIDSGSYEVNSEAVAEKMFRVIMDETG